MKKIFEKIQDWWAEEFMDEPIGLKAFLTVCALILAKTMWDSVLIILNKK